MVGIYNYTVIATYLGLVSGSLGIFFAFRGNAKAALICLMVAGILDAFDGRIARTKKDRTETELRFGIQIDSLCDLVSFGVLPTVICFSLGMQGMGHILLYAFFTLTAVIRLAYFNVLAEETKNKKGCAAYLGLPVTSICMLLPTLYIVGSLVEGILSALLIGGIFVTAVLYITPIRIKKPDMPAIAAAMLIGLAEMTILLCGKLP